MNDKPKDIIARFVLPYNPTREVRTEPVRSTIGKMPAFEPEQAHRLFERFDLEKLIDLRDRAIVGVIAYTFKCVSAVCDLCAQDYIDLGRTGVLRLHERGASSVFGGQLLRAIFHNT